MKLYQIDMYLYKVASKKNWTVYSGDGHKLEQGKYEDMIKKYGDDDVLFLNMQEHIIYLHETEDEVLEHLAILEWARELAKECE